ncbi:MAG: glycosyltransferase family 92 protein [Parachlamydiaceae bacterium]
MKRFTVLASFFLCLACVHLLSYPPLPYEELFISHPENIEQVTPNEISVGCVFRDEASWLKEWIEFHLLIGVDHFYLYNNCSQDHYLEVLLPYIRNGTIELFDFPKQDWSNRDQNYMYNHTLALAKGTSKWLAIIDTDEFINPLESASLKEYLENYKQAASIYVKWQLFGTSKVRNLKYGQLLIDKLIFRAPDGNTTSEAWGKSIYQTQLTDSIDNPHWGTHPKNSYVHHPTTNEIKVNHYTYRTEFFLYTVKLPRLKIFKGGHLFGTSRALLNFLPIANSKRDHTVERYVTPLKIKCFGEDQNATPSG